MFLVFKWCIQIPTVLQNKFSAVYIWRSDLDLKQFYSFRYDLLEFSQVVQAVKDGNLLMLNEALDKNEKFFIRCGIFLILEKLKIITYRYFVLFLLHFGV